jgi:hypothetical protein
VAAQALPEVKCFCKRLMMLFFDINDRRGKIIVFEEKELVIHLEKTLCLKS